VLNVFWTLIYPSSGACDYSVESPHRLFWSRFDVCWRFGAAGTQTQPNREKTTDVVIQQQSRKLLMVDIWMSETCWAHKKWNKIASDIKLVFYSSTITVMHGPINIRWMCMLQFSSKTGLTHRVWQRPSRCVVTKLYIYIKVKHSRYRPGQAQRVPGS